MRRLKMKPDIYLYILVMFAVTYAIRVIPLTLLRKPITNRFVKSFLFYVPYVTLALMTFPAIVEATSSPVYGIIAFILGVVLSWITGNMFLVEICCCLAVLIMNMLF